MTQRIRAVAAMLLTTVLAGAVVAGGRATTPRQQVAGADDYRSAVEYHAAVMNHCKAINTLARARGAFNVTLAREHSEEVSRNLSSAAKHLSGYRSEEHTS